jgi:hypothetical protein
MFRAPATRNKQVCWTVVINNFLITMYAWFMNNFDIFLCENSKYILIFSI